MLWDHVNKIHLLKINLCSVRTVVEWKRREEASCYPVYLQKISAENSKYR